MKKGLFPTGSFRDILWVIQNYLMMVSGLLSIISLHLTFILCKKKKQVLYNRLTFYKRYFFLSNPVKPSSESALNDLDS